MILDEINRIIAKYRYIDNIEIEVRLGWNQNDKKQHCNGSFDTNIHERYFIPLLNRMKESNANHCVFDKHTFSISDVYFDNKTNSRVITSPNRQVVSHCKMKLEILDYDLEGTPFDLRIVVSIETPSELGKDDGTMTHVRTRYRDSFFYKMWVYDLTISKYTNPVHDEQFVYEFEIELDCKKAANLNSSTSYLSNSLLLKIQDIVNMNLIDNEIIHLKNYRYSSNRTTNQHLLQYVCHPIQKL
jgi:hypothetical protein